MVKRILEDKEVTQLDSLANEVPALSLAHTKSTAGKLELGSIIQQLQGKHALVAAIISQAAEASNGIDLAMKLVDLDGDAPTEAKRVLIEVFAATANEGDLAAASSAVGTILEALNPATGMCLLLMETTTAGLFSFKVADTVAEKCFVRVTPEGGEPVTFVLTFA